MKRYLVLLVTIVLLMVEVNGVYAAIGDVYTYTKYTDIYAYINGFILPSYNIEGYTGVVAEDLRTYGFDVVWNEEDRTLKISRNTAVRRISEYIQPTETAPVDLGKNAYPVLTTDIKTYINDVEVASYNIDGKTVIRFDSLVAFGDIVWDENERKIKLFVSDIEMAWVEASPKMLPRVTLYSLDGRNIEVYEYETEAYLNVGWYTKEKIDEIRSREKNVAAVKKFHVGQQVLETQLLGMRYGIVKAIDIANGKVKVYWTRATDFKGNEKDYFNGSVFHSLYSETWEDAYYLKPLY